MPEKRIADVRIRCEHYGCDISAKMCFGRQHIGKTGWRGERYSFKALPKDEFCMSGKCIQGQRVLKYLEDGNMERISQYVTTTPIPTVGAGSKPAPYKEKTKIMKSEKSPAGAAGTPPATPNVAIATPNVAPAIPVKTKVCNYCKETKPLGDFNRDASTQDGHDRFCRVCKTAKNREARALKKANGGITRHPLYAAASQPSPPVRAVPPTPAPNSVVTLDFACCPSVLETLERISREEFRTPGQQILYFLSKHMAAKEALRGTEAQAR